MATGVLATAVALVLAVESGNDPAVRDGDGGKAVGVAQCWPIMVREVNRVAGARFTLADRRDPVRARQMVRAYLAWRARRSPGLGPVELAARWRNPSGGSPEWHVVRLRTAYNRLMERGRVE